MYTRWCTGQTYGADPAVPHDIFVSGPPRATEPTPAFPRRCRCARSAADRLRGPSFAELGSGSPRPGLTRPRGERRSVLQYPRHPRMGATDCRSHGSPDTAPGGPGGGDRGSEVGGRRLEWSRWRATSDCGTRDRKGTSQRLDEVVMKHPPIPSSWARARIADVGSVRVGRQRSPEKHSGRYGTKYLRAKNITSTGLDLTDVLEMDFTPSERATYELRSGDLLVAEASGSAKHVGRAAIWRNEIPNCCFQNTLIRLRPARHCAGVRAPNAAPSGSNGRIRGGSAGRRHPTPRCLQIC